VPTAWARSSRPRLTRLCRAGACHDGQICGYELTTPDDNNRVAFYRAHPQARTRIDLADLRQAAARIQLIRMRSVVQSTES
jgi:hypothetical protein